VAELKSKAGGLQSDQLSKQELLKLQVMLSPAGSPAGSFLLADTVIVLEQYNYSIIIDSI